MSRPALLYDGDCRFCRFVARVVLRLDRHERVALARLQDAEAATLLPGLSEEERLGSIHLVENGRVSSRGEALTELSRRLGLPAPKLLGRAYEPVAQRRRALGRLVPDGPAPRRYP